MLAGSGELYFFGSMCIALQYSMYSCSVASSQPVPIGIKPSLYTCPVAVLRKYIAISFLWKSCTPESLALIGLSLNLFCACLRSDCFQMLPRFSILGKMLAPESLAPAGRFSQALLQSSCGHIVLWLSPLADSSILLAVDNCKMGYCTKIY